jgi:hypothetical protein
MCEAYQERPAATTLSVAVGTTVRELSGEQGSDFLRRKARGEVKLGVDEVKRRKEWRKVGLVGVTGCRRHMRDGGFCRW